MFPYTARDALHFTRMFFRNRRRQKVWEHAFEHAIRQGTFRLPHAAVVQLIPTEACNLRCPMCNQWGENGYFLKGIRPVQHMEPQAVATLLDSLSPKHSLVSVHGGEPFAYKHLEMLLERLRARAFDVIFTTNGTLLEKCLEPLARIENLAMLLSIDGDEETHDRIRGKNRFRQARDGLKSLFECRRRLGLPLPLVILSFVVCEWNTHAIEAVYQVARDFGVLAVNYNMRWFLTEDVGKAYERHLQDHFQVKSSGAWRGWVSEHEHDYRDAAAILRRLVRSKKYRLTPPYVVTTPGRMQGRDFEKYFADYLEVFGNESCFMPFYWARIHANGDLIYCPGHPDIIAGNVFRQGFLEAFNSEISIRFRKHILENRFPICNRCCGLYMTQPGRKHEQRVRRRVGLPKRVTVHWP